MVTAEEAFRQLADAAHPAVQHQGTHRSGQRVQPWRGGDEIRLVIPFGQGGATDVLFRLIARPVSERLGRRIMLENVPGRPLHAAPSGCGKLPWTAEPCWVATRR